MRDRVGIYPSARVYLPNDLTFGRALLFSARSLPFSLTRASFEKYFLKLLSSTIDNRRSVYRRPISYNYESVVLT